MAKTFSVILLVAFLAVLFSGCTSVTVPPSAEATFTPAPTAAPASTPSARPTVAAPKLDFKAFSKSIATFLDAPGWASLCGASCETYKEIVPQIFCSLPVSENADAPLNPLWDAFGRPDASSAEEANAYIKKCQSITPEVIFDCDAFDKGIFSCGSLPGCEGNGFYLRFDRVKFRSVTGYDVDELVFVNSTLPSILAKDGCLPAEPTPEPS